jgi:mycothiol synthase
VRAEIRDDNNVLVLLEADPASIADDAYAADHGLVCCREILQLRRPLPLDDATDIEVRPFVENDTDAFLRVNNRAFAWHPDRSNLTADDLHAQLAEPWFDPSGFLVHETDGELDGFCWTKVHEATADEPRLGEIYVIAVDPDSHGRGLGRALTMAGLQWLAGQGITSGMLHVESGNLAAVAMYEHMGFEVFAVHRWWATEGTPPPVTSHL